MTKHVNEYNQYDQITIQSIWSERNLSVKKSRLISEIISNFKFKQKQQSFIDSINRCNTHAGLDKILSNIILYGEGLKSIKT